LRPITATSTGATIHLLTITATGTNQHRTARTPVSTSAAVMQQNRPIRISTTATTPASTVAFMQLTDNATHVPVTIHNQRVKQFRTVIMTSAVAPVTFTAQRCPSWVDALRRTILRLLKRDVQRLAVLTSISHATMSPHIVPHTWQATANVTLVALPL